MYFVLLSALRYELQTCSVCKIYHTTLLIKHLKAAARPTKVLCSKQAKNTAQNSQIHRGEDKKLNDKVIKYRGVKINLYRLKSVENIMKHTFLKNFFRKCYIILFHVLFFHNPQQKEIEKFVLFGTSHLDLVLSYQPDLSKYTKSDILDLENVIFQSKCIPHIDPLLYWLTSPFL